MASENMKLSYFLGESVALGRHVCVGHLFFFSLLTFCARSNDVNELCRDAMSTAKWHCLNQLVFEQAVCFLLESWKTINFYLLLLLGLHLSWRLVRVISSFFLFSPLPRPYVWRFRVQASLILQNSDHAEANCWHGLVFLLHVHVD